MIVLSHARVCRPVPVKEGQSLVMVRAVGPWPKQTELAIRPHPQCVQGCLRDLFRRMPPIIGGPTQNQRIPAVRVAHGYLVERERSIGMLARSLAAENFYYRPLDDVSKKLHRRCRRPRSINQSCVERAKICQRSKSCQIEIVGCKRIERCPDLRFSFDEVAPAPCHPHDLRAVSN